jgi:predicted flap endonuclease-1-like 5' DNA nuclease
MPTLRWEGDSRFTDQQRDFVARPNTEHDLSDEQAEEYGSHALFGDDWVAVEAATKSEADESDSGGQSTDESDASEETGGDGFTTLDGVGDATAEHLRDAGYETFNDLRNASVDDLASVESITDGKAESIADQVQNEA